MRGMGGHQSTAALKDEWLTPPSIITALGPFDLDPCAPIDRPWETAREHYTINDDGYARPWFGRVWLNPPYGSDTGRWLRKLSEHGNGIALVFARTETEAFHRYVWPSADALFFFAGRLYFRHVTGQRANANAGAPSVLIAYGRENAERLRDFGWPGKYTENQRGGSTPLFTTQEADHAE
jgi:hypothetical protein